MVKKYQDFLYARITYGYSFPERLSSCQIFFDSDVVTCGFEFFIWQPLLRKASYMGN